VLAKHSESFSLIDCISVGVDRMQRNFEPMRKQVEAWQRSELTDVTPRLSSTKRLWREDWKLRNTWRAPCTISTSNQSTRNSVHGRSGASRMRSLRHPRNSTPFRSSRRQRNWESFWRLDSRSRSSLGRYRPGRCFDCLTLGNVIYSLVRFLSRPLHELVVPKSVSTAFRRCEAITRYPKS
jgi:hypothetical protein